MDRQVFTVTQVNEFIKALLDGAAPLQGLYVRGELSNYKIYPSGHHYFTLKDGASAIRCVMFASSASRLRFRPENGMKVIAAGRISVYPRDGAYQLYCTSLSVAGVGDLYVAFEQLKEKLLVQGLFDDAHKKPLPRYPQRIVLITSPAGAAVHDMIRILRRRYPIAKVLLLPVRVQGTEAPYEIAEAIRYANRHQVADLIITGRGGGSVEDLWAFNDEGVARAIYDTVIPVISAVGHEPDVTISDFVADARAATPSNAAELAVPDMTDLLRRLGQQESRMQQGVRSILTQRQQQLDSLGNRRVLAQPLGLLQNHWQRLDLAAQRLGYAMQRQLDEHQRVFAQNAAALDAMSPLKVLGRGYAIAQDMQGHVLRSSRQAECGDTVRVRLGEGSLRCTVENREE